MIQRFKHMYACDILRLNRPAHFSRKISPVKMPAYCELGGKDA